jgi:hypothetical protein
MVTNREDLHQLVDQLPEAEIAAAARFLQFLSQEPIGPEFAVSIRRGIAQADAGELLVCRNFEEMAEKLLGNG